MLHGCGCSAVRHRCLPSIIRLEPGEVLRDVGAGAGAARAVVRVVGEAQERKRLFCSQSVATTSHDHVPFRLMAEGNGLGGQLRTLSVPQIPPPGNPDKNSSAIWQSPMLAHRAGSVKAPPKEGKKEAGLPLELRLPRPLYSDTACRGACSRDGASRPRTGPCRSTCSRHAPSSCSPR